MDYFNPSFFCYQLFKNPAISFPQNDENYHTGEKNA
jgi:hypothetical protein